MQASDVISQGLDFTVVELGRDLVHLQAVFAHAVAKRGQLRRSVLGVLAANAGILDGQARTIGAVATGTGGYLTIGDAATVNFLAQGNQLFVLRKTGLGGFAADPKRDVAHVIVGQGSGQTGHHRVGPLAGFEFLQLLDQVLWVLLCQLGVRRRAGITVGAMAGGANGAKTGFAFGQIGLGGFGGRRRRIGRSVKYAGSHGCDEEQGGNRLHDAMLLRVGKNTTILQCGTGLARHNNHNSMTSLPKPNLAAAKEIAPGAKSAAVTALGWLHTARFLTTAPQLHFLPELDVPEIAFVGRSNAGKSTCINTLTQQKQLAFASKRPGRTQHINLFALGKQGATDAVLTDLPGYGYAAVPKQDKIRWQQVMANYLVSRSNLQGIVLMCDPRHGMTELDEILLDVIRPRVEEGLKFLVILTKADKLTRSEGAKALSIAKLQAGGGQVRLFSATKRTGLEDVATLLWDWAHPAGADGAAGASLASPSTDATLDTPGAPDATQAPAPQ